MGRLVVGVVAALLVAAGGIVGPGGAGAQEGTPVPGRDAPAPEECRVEPRSLASFQALATPGAASTAPAVPPEAPEGLPPGEPADAATAAAIGATVRELLACYNAGERLRIFAFYSDGFLRPLFGAPAPFSQGAYDRFATPQPVPPELRVALVAIGEVRLLADGRAGAVVTVDDPNAATGPSTTSSFLVFVRAGDRWLLDAAIEDVAADAAGTPGATPGA
jgi:hypothetical protein